MALALRVLIPTGYMVTNDQGHVAITLCSSFVEQQPSMMMSMAGMDHSAAEHGKSKGHGKSEMPCAFSGLAAPSLGGADPAVLVAALAVVAATALHSSPRTIIAAASYLRPPLRGPPLFH